MTELIAGWIENKTSKALATGQRGTYLSGRIVCPSGQDCRRRRLSYRRRTISACGIRDSRYNKRTRTNGQMGYQSVGSRQVKRANQRENRLRHETLVTRLFFVSWQTTGRWMCDKVSRSSLFVKRIRPPIEYSRNLHDRFTFILFYRSGTICQSNRLAARWDRHTKIRNPILAPPCILNSVPSSSIVSLLRK